MLCQTECGRALPVSKLTAAYDRVKDMSDIPPLTIRQIEHFFSYYKDLESGKWMKLQGWQAAEKAREEILRCVGRYNAASPRPNF